MQRMICIPEWRYNLMLKTFEELTQELEKLKEELKNASAEAGTSAKAGNP